VPSCQSRLDILLSLAGAAPSWPALPTMMMMMMMMMKKKKMMMMKRVL